ncbi:TrmH family RNA methyltransferase [Corynebacterium caspium]|uniref:TrmH family RNA methyltransferase n=1 Tax=Corynebacterium caspium TaxID=234828 RepID=UPI000370F7C0|nr:RNA methyltransferase [Corynebacterium caspium]WKD59371.1 Putative TrmH family tRNA/rRNA methyltransferase [Corynebacterium caspium DSM 44850]
MDLDFENPYTERTPRVVAAAKLHRGNARRKAKAFIVEGENSVEAAIATGAAKDLFVTAEAAERFAEIVKTARYLDVFIHPITAKAADTLADTVSSPGIFAVCSPVLWSMRNSLKRPRLVSVPVETRDPGNAGTLIRISDAVGADAVIFAGDTVDPQASKVVRSSAGSLFHLPVARERDIHRVLGSLQNQGLQILATAADGELSLDDAEEVLAKPTAWLFGNEAHGLSEELAARADHRIAIPIRGSAESLNLATAAAICLYESARVQARSEREFRSSI